jgi:hypothetical protein
VSLLTPIDRMHGFVLDLCFVHGKKTNGLVFERKTPLALRPLTANEPTMSLSRV